MSLTILQFANVTIDSVLSRILARDQKTSAVRAALTSVRK